MQSQTKQKNRQGKARQGNPVADWVDEQNNVSLTAGTPSGSPKPQRPTMRCLFPSIKAHKLPLAVSPAAN